MRALRHVELPCTGTTWRRLAAVFTLATLTPGAAGGVPADETGRYERLFDALWETVDANFYDPDFLGTDWSGVRARYVTRAAGVTDDQAFIRLAAEALGEIGSSHLHLSAPTVSAAIPAGIGARTGLIEDRLTVTEVAVLSDARRRGLRPGDRLLTPRDALPGPLGSTATIAVEHCDGRTGEFSVRRERAFWPPERPGFRWHVVRGSSDTRIGYLRIDRFDDGAAELADRAMRDLADAAAVIIDLRGNSGGNTSALRLASYFGPGAEPAVTLLARPYLEALGHPVTTADVAAAPRVNGAYTDEAVFAAVSAHRGAAAFWTEDVPRFSGKVIVLIGEETGSAAEGFAWYMRLRTSARLVGRTTSGALLSGERFDLGGGWSVTVPVHGLWGPDGEDLGDRAVPPHVPVTWSRADLCNQRDPDLETAFRIIDKAE